MSFQEEASLQTGSVSYIPPPDAAHWMAIAAMEQFAHYIASFGIPPVEDPRGDTEDVSAPAILPAPEEGSPAAFLGYHL